MKKKTWEKEFSNIFDWHTKGLTWANLMGFSDDLKQFIEKLLKEKEEEVGGEIMLILKNEEVPLIVRHHKAIRKIKQLTHGKKSK